MNTILIILVIIIGLGLQAHGDSPSAPEKAQSDALLRLADALEKMAAFTSQINKVEQENQKFRESHPDIIKNIQLWEQLSPMFAEEMGFEGITCYVSSKLCLDKLQELSPSLSKIKLMLDNYKKAVKESSGEEATIALTFDRGISHPYMGTITLNAEENAATLLEIIEVSLKALLLSESFNKNDTGKSLEEVDALDEKLLQDLNKLVPQKLRDKISMNEMIL